MNEQPRGGEALDASARDRLRPGTPFEWIADLPADHVADELVEGLIERGGMGVCYGEPGSGKSHLVLDLAFRVSKGAPWLGRRTSQGPVLFVAHTEAGRSIQSPRRRLRTRVPEYAGAMVAVITVPVDLRDPSADTKGICAAAKRICEETGLRMQLVIVDTFRAGLRLRQRKRIGGHGCAGAQLRPHPHRDPRDGAMGSPCRKRLDQGRTRTFATARRDRLRNRMHERGRHRNGALYESARRRRRR